MDIYKKYQPVTWDIGVVEATPKAVIESIQPRYVPFAELEGIYQKKKTIEEGLSSLEPLGCPTKFLLVKAVDGRTVIFRNSSAGVVELPIWNATEDLNVSGYYVCNTPNTISKDQMSGAWGARKIEYRIPGNTIVQEPTFGIHLINDCGRWCFYRYGEKQPFENEKAYEAWRKTDRFTEKMLIDYCQALGIPIYNRDFYSDEWILIEGKPIRPSDKGLSFKEAANELHIDRS